MMQFDPQSGWTSDLNPNDPINPSDASLAPEAKRPADAAPTDNVVRFGSVTSQSHATRQKNSDGNEWSNMNTKGDGSSDGENTFNPEGLSTIDLVHQLFQRLEDGDRSLDALSDLKLQLSRLDALTNQEKEIEANLADVRGQIELVRAQIKEAMNLVRAQEEAGLEARNLRLTVINKLIDKYEG